MNDGDPLERLLAFLRSATVREVQAWAGGRVIGVGWATVELDRAVVELGSSLRTPPDRFVDAVASVSLGARCLVANAVLPGGVSLVAIEPNTEGRLAGTLARHGEGPVAAWLAASPSTTASARLSRASTGPFGPERLVVDGPIHGPHRYLVEGPLPSAHD